MSKTKFVFAVSFCAMFAASAAVASAPKSDNTDIGSAHSVFTDLAPTDENGAGAGIAGVTYVNRAVNRAGTAAIAAEAHAAAAGAYAVSAKSSADTAVAAAGDAQTAADAANAALAGKQDKLTAGSNITIDNGTISATVPQITVDTSLSASSTNPVQNKVLAAALDAKVDDAVIVNEAPIDGQDSVVPTVQLTQTMISDSASEIGDALTDIDNALKGKQATLTAAQLAAVNSGINADKVSAYDGYATTISGKQATLTTTNVVTDGTGNVVTAVTAANGTVTVTKGTTLGSLATKSAVASADITDGTIATADIAGGAVTADKTSGVIGKVPSGSETSTTLASIWVQ
ncbi:MAG: hypothetical protein E7011_03720 [Alphaproteobacteria bacterium]|nr:hypothetical protein [Alphaproteobacteria bacterium]